MGHKKRPVIDRSFSSLSKILLCSLNRLFAELFEVLHEFESSFAGAGTSGFVTFYYLSVSVDCEGFAISFDFLYKSFHDF